MKRPNLPSLPVLAGIFSASLFAGVPSVQAATASTTPLGYTTIECLWSSDTLCSTAGITEKPDFIGNPTGAPVANVLTVNATPGWTANDFADTHYLRFTSGAKIGRYYTVTANGANTLTLDPAGDDLSTVTASDGIKLVKYWTLGTLFPQATQTTIVESLSNSPFARRSEVFFPDMTNLGTNLAPTSKYFITSAGWVNASGNTAANDQVVLPDQYFIVRHRDASLSGGLGDADGTEFVPMGHVESSPTTIALTPRVTGSGGQDVPLALSRPVAVTLAESDLISSGAFLGSPSASPFVRRDELFVFDLNVDAITADDMGQNRAPVNKYFYDLNAGNWVNSATSANADAELVFQPGAGMFIRKYNTATGETEFWVYDPSS